MDEDAPRVIPLVVGAEQLVIKINLTPVGDCKQCRSKWGGKDKCSIPEHLGLSAFSVLGMRTGSNWEAIACTLWNVDAMTKYSFADK